MRTLSTAKILTALFVTTLAISATSRVYADETLTCEDSTRPETCPVLHTSTAPLKNLPILFVQGHGGFLGSLSSTPNYQKNWIDPLARATVRLPSFAQALTQNPDLGIEPYYLELPENDARSITADARAIGEAVEIILHRHDSDYPEHPTSVQVVIIAYSKGTLSARQYLKSLRVQVENLPPPRPPNSFPVSEFIAIAPPNHGITLPSITQTDPTSLSVKQLYNGYRLEPPCDEFGDAQATDYITRLNTDAVTDEAPGSRAATQRPTDGTLYVTMFDAQNRDFVGGDAASTDCRGRGVAVNQSSNAINIPIGDIPGGGVVESLRVHQNTVHMPEVICKALYAAVYHQSPRTQTCQTTTLSTNEVVPLIPPPSRAGAILALDFSNSMRTLACSSCTTRAAVLKEAVEIFLQLWSAVSVATDSVGVRYFQTNVTSFPADGTLIPLTNMQDVITNLNSQGPGGSTAMGGALESALDKLTTMQDPPSIRRVILFTDGMQNVNPMVTEVQDHHEIIDRSGFPNSNVPSTGRRLDQLGGIHVDTIGIGAGDTFVTLLQDIADETGGRPYVTTAPDDDLRRFFIEALINGLRGFSPQLVAYRHGSVGAAGSIEPFTIEDGVKKIVLKVSWKRGDSLDFSVAKNGVDVTSRGRFINGPFYKIFVIDKWQGSTRGNWTVRIKGRPNAPYETAAIVDGGYLSLDARFLRKNLKLGGALDLIVRPAARGQAVTQNVNVTVAFSEPVTTAADVIKRVRPEPVPLLEPGLSIVDRQLLAIIQNSRASSLLKPRMRNIEMRRVNVKEFRARFRPRVPGVYVARIQVAGTSTKAGPFTRTLMLTTVVREANK